MHANTTAAHTFVPDQDEDGQDVDAQSGDQREGDIDDTFIQQR